MIEELPCVISAGNALTNFAFARSLRIYPRQTDYGSASRGGIDTRVVLNHGTPATVRAQVLERLKIFTPGGGYIFNTVHNILPDVPPENVVAMFDAVREFNTAGA